MKMITLMNRFSSWLYAKTQTEEPELDEESFEKLEVQKAFEAGFNVGFWEARSNFEVPDIGSEAAIH
jgi:hypothetical protein